MRAFIRTSMWTFVHFCLTAAGTIPAFGRSAVRTLIGFGVLGGMTLSFIRLSLVHMGTLSMGRRMVSSHIGFALIMAFAMR